MGDVPTGMVPGTIRDTKLVHDKVRGLGFLVLGLCLELGVSKEFLGGLLPPYEL